MLVLIRDPRKQLLRKSKNLQESTSENQDSNYSRESWPLKHAGSVKLGKKHNPHLLARISRQKTQEANLISCMFENLSGNPIELPVLDPNPERGKNWNEILGLERRVEERESQSERVVPALTVVDWVIQKWRHCTLFIAYS